MLSCFSLTTTTVRSGGASGAIRSIVCCTSVWSPAKAANCLGSSAPYRRLVRVAIRLPSPAARTMFQTRPADCFIGILPVGDWRARKLHDAYQRGRLTVGGCFVVVTPGILH